MPNILRSSTPQWVTSMVENRINHQKILLKFEERGRLEKSIKREGEPVNILCFDGGGMRGYALVVMIEMMQKKAGKNLLDCFDLVGGTSVGGCAALICNRSDSFETGHMLMRDVIDDVREDCFEGMKSGNNFLRLFSEGNLLQKDQYMIETLKKRYPDETLLNKNGVPSFVVTTKKVKTNGNEEEVEFEPYILRSYDYENKDGAKKDIYTPLADSTSSVLLHEAMAATSAVPPLVDRVKVTCNGKQVALGDGGLVSNCPVVHALDEAKRLYPGRPIGVIVSLGFTNDQDANANRAVDVMRLSSPGLHFQRISPHKIMDSFEPITTDLTQIAVMESKIRDYMVNTARVANALDVTIERLLQSSRAPRGNAPLQSSKVFDSMIKSSKFEMRQSCRLASSVAYMGPLGSILGTIDDDDDHVSSDNDDDPKSSEGSEGSSTSHTSTVEPPNKIVNSENPFAKQHPKPNDEIVVVKKNCQCAIC